MKIISTKVHGVLDYLMGLLLIASPWLFGFANVGAAQQIPVILGIVMLVMAMSTNYELGAIRVVSMPAHLLMDVLSGLFLAVSPWLFQFSDSVYLPHLILGVAEIGAAAITKRVPFVKHSPGYHYNS